MHFFLKKEKIVQNGKRQTKYATRKKQKKNINKDYINRKQYPSLNNIIPLPFKCPYPEIKDYYYISLLVPS